MRKGFNWSQLDRNNLYSMLYSAGRDIVGKKLPVSAVQKQLSSHIKSNLPVKVIRKQNDPKQKHGFVYLGGTYYSDIDMAGRDKFMEIVLSYHPEDKEIKLTEYRWMRICAVFADTVLHEIIHMRQYRSRNFKSIPGYESTAYYHKQRVDQEYYGDRDEMGAFSFNIACEMLDRFGYDPREIMKYMDSMRAKRHKKTTYFKMLSAFDWNHDHIKIKQMKRKILKQLEYAAIGKPFKTTNYLTY
jgi:hypothetical protein